MFGCSMFTPNLVKAPWSDAESRVKKIWVVFAGTLGAQGVAKICFRVLLHVDLNLVPVTLVVAYPLAERADRNNAT